MQRPNPPSPARVLPAVSLLLLAAFVTASGCKKDEPAPPPVVSDSTARTYQGIGIEFPKEWSAADEAESKGLIVSPPPKEDDDYPAGIYFVVEDQSAGTDLKESLEKAFQDMYRSTDFILKDKQIVNHPSGFKYARLEYTKRSEAAGTNIPLTRRDLLVPMGSTKRLRVQASAATADWIKYEPAFSKVIDSIKLP